MQQKIINLSKHASSVCCQSSVSPSILSSLYLELPFPPPLFAPWVPSSPTQIPAFYRVKLVAQMVKNLHAGDPGSTPESGKVGWRREWLPTPVFLPGKSHGQRSICGLQPMRSQKVRHD